MKMCLTRIGFNSKAIVNGDVTQIDLPRHQSSGLVDAVGRLEGIDSIGIFHLETEDIIRHPVVAHIVNAYESSPNHP